MKKLLYVFSILLFALLITGCGEKEKENKPPVNKPANNDEYVKGVLTENSFKSEYLNLRFTLPEGYIMATQEDMENMMDLGAAILDIDKNIIDYTKVALIYEMMVSSPTGSPNVVLMAEKLRLTNMTEDQYLSTMKAQLLDMSAIDYSFNGEIEEVEIAGQKYKKLSLNAEMSSQKMLQDYIIRKEKDRIICFIVTYSVDTKEQMEVLMNGFSKY